jgi:RNA polymerase sigma-70 factor, ECF subfamily
MPGWRIVCVVNDLAAPSVAELEALYRERFAAFARVASAIAGDEQRGVDAVQDAFANAILGLADYRGEAPLEAWLWRIVLNAALSLRRRQRPEPDAPPAASGNGRPDDDYEVRTWIAALPERQRLAVFLRYYADLDYRNIAHALGVEVGTVSATLNAAHTALRRSHLEAHT